MRIAVIGAGISGLGAAWALRAHHQVTLYEQAARLGGHSNTVEATVAGATIPVDTGFIVYNDVNYPNLVALFRALDVATEPSDMSFAVSIGGGALEYSGTDLKGLIAQSRNLVRPRFWRMMVDVVRFYRAARVALRGGTPADLTVGEFLDLGGYSAGFIDDHLLPMGAAIWSTPIERMRDFPLLNFAHFFDTHGLLRLTDRPRWRTVTGGSRAYVARIAAALGPHAIRHAAVTRVRRLPGGVEVADAQGETRMFDHAVLACHGDQALRLLADADDHERRLLGAFRFQPNRAVLHSDTSLMPHRRAAWASWNYLAPDRAQARTGAVAVTYWMNRLQNLDPARPLFITLNPPTLPRADLTHRVIDYDHPVFDRAAIRAQTEIAAIQGARRTWFAGAWLGYGFHEDGLVSGLAVARALGADIPWPTAVAPAGIRPAPLLAAE
ncbi:MAG: FAD-dependent oxidoreductase [Proteobacteria bacterium]|nr:FAD-dependent oxidoreductase [Pseudomonadota bacterium]